MNKRLALALALGLVAVWTSERPSAAETPIQALRCYVNLACFGNTAVADEPENFLRLVDHYYAVPPASPVPKLSEIRASAQARFLAFEKSCNAKRYALTNLPSDLSAAWNADTRDMYTVVATSCLPAQECSGVGGPCSRHTDCCSPDGARPSDLRCDAIQGSCVATRALPSPDLDD